MKTLQQLVEELGLKPADVEIALGRSKTPNGYSLVLVSDNDFYVTIYPSEKRLANSTYKHRIMVRG